ncbi:LmbU family transcriptional regulator [Streptomyces sp. PmtG]
MIYGESSYSSHYREAIERTGLDYKTLRNYAWVARRFEHHRRREVLSFAHHAEVARLPTPEQDYWLRKAEQRSWSRNELRRQVRTSLAEREGTAAAPPRAVGTAHARHVTTRTAPAARAPIPVGQRRVPADRARVAAAEIQPCRVTTIEIDLPVTEFDQVTRIAETFGLSRSDWAARVLQSVVRTLAETKAGGEAPVHAS